MKNRWGILEEEGYESILVAMDDRLERVMKDAKNKLVNGGDKMILAFKVEVQMVVFMDNFTALFDVNKIHIGFETIHAAFESELGIQSMKDYDQAKEEIDEIFKLLKRRKN